MNRNSQGDRDTFSVVLRLVYSGALAIAVVAISELLSVDKKALDLPLTVAIYCFAVSMPLMTVGILLLTAENVQGFSRLSSLTGFVLTMGSVVGLFASLAGLFCLFWHFHPRAAVTFLVITVVSYGAWLRRHAIHS